MTPFMHHRVRLTYIRAKGREAGGLEQGDIILCVDDDSTVLNALRSVFAKHFGAELQVEFAESGDEALEIARQCPGLLSSGSGVEVIEIRSAG